MADISNELPHRRLRGFHASLPVVLTVVFLYYLKSTTLYIHKTDFLFLACVLSYKKYIVIMQTFQQFRETGLGDVVGTNDFGGTREHIVDELIDLLVRNSGQLRAAWLALIGSEKIDTETQNNIKKIMGLVENLKDKPKSHQKKFDPLSNVVARSYAGPDSPEALSNENKK